MPNTSILGYCRPGYENDTANELTSRYGEAQCYGYPVSKKNSGFVLYHLYDGSQLEQTITQFAVHDSIYPRQLVAVFATLNDIEKEDRVGQVLEALEEVEKPFSIFGAIYEFLKLNFSFNSDLICFVYNSFNLGIIF